MPFAQDLAEPHANDRRWLPWATAASALLAFAADLALGRTHAGPILYIAPPLFAFWSSSRRLPWLAGTIATVLALVAAVVRSDAGATLLFERALALGAVWMIVATCRAHQRQVAGRRKAEEAVLGQAALARLGEMSLMVAHEVKNPLAGLRGALQLLGNKLEADPSVTPVVQRALRSIDGLSGLVDDLVVYARPGLPRRAAVQVLPLLCDVATSLEGDPKLGGRAIHLTGAEAVISGDRRLLRQAFLNLLLNAAEAGGPGGEVRVRVSPASQGCQVEIADQGPGIPADAREKVFEPFYSTKAHGSGLGLAIALRVITLHGGQIEIECPAAGGTVVTVRLP